MKLLKLEEILVMYFLVFISLMHCTQSYNISIPNFRCGLDVFKPIEVSKENIIPIYPQSKRILDNIDKDGFKDFNIYLDLCNFEEEVINFNLKDKKELFVQGMTKAVNTLKSLLRVKPHQKNWGFYDEQIERISINKWNKSLIGNETSKGMIDLDIDLFIFARFDDKEHMGELTLASAGARYLEPGNGKPLIGVVNINREVDYSKENSLQYFEGIIIHEFTHILGFSNNYFTNYFHNVFSKVDDFRINRTYINSTKVVEVGKKYFNCDSLEGIALEDSGGKGTVGSHWEARILLGDYMNGVAFTSEQVISEFTLALLEDSGYYKANYYTGGLMQFGKNKGCDFVNKKCIEDGKLDPKYTNEFFYNIYTVYGNYDTSCSSDRQSRAYHIIFAYESLDKQYQYFQNPKYGGFSSAEYCPISYPDLKNEGSNSYYVGHCSEIGSGEYGSHIHYNKDNKIHKSAEIKDIIGENYSGNSFCVLSSLISKSKENYEYYSNTIRAVCYQMHCSDRSLTIQINNDYIVCPRAGGKINAINYEGYLSCPDYYLICSGSVLCNDMYSCVEKKSLLKDDIVYDYEIKTTQDLEVIENEAFSDDSYELSTNGKCSQYCSQCNELNQCIKCRKNFGIVEFNENELTKRECKSIDELKDGYYKNEDNSIYYKCLDNCKKCSNDSECITCNEGYSKSVNNNNKCFLIIDKCKDYDKSEKCSKCELGYETFGNGTICKIGIDKCIEVDSNGNCTKCEENYILSNQICYKKIEKCEEYEIEEKCKKCEEGYAFEENDRLNCKNINKFEEYYTKDNGLSYFKCDGTSEENIPNCKKCIFNNDKLICNECKDNYIKDVENNKCYLKEASMIITYPNSTILITNPKTLITNLKSLKTNPTTVVTSPTTFITNPKTMLINTTNPKTLINNQTTINSNPTTFITNPKASISNQIIINSNPTTIITNPTALLSNSKTIIKNPTTSINNPTTIIKNPTTSINNPTTILTNPTTSINNPTTIVTNPTTLLSNSKTIITNPTALLSNPTTIITNPTTIVTNPTTSINNPTTSINNPTKIITNPTTLLSNSKTILTNPTTLLSNSKTIITNPTTIITNPTTIVTNPTTLLSNSKTIFTNPTTLLSSSKTIFTNPTTLLSNSKTIFTNPATSINNPTTFMTNQAKSINNPTTLLSNSKTIITNPKINNSTTIITNPKTLISNSTTIITHPKTIITNPKTLISIQTANITNLTTSINNPTTIIINPKTSLSNSISIFTNPKTIITNPKSSLSSSATIITTKLKSQIIKTIVIKTTELKNNTDHYELAINKIILFLLQVNLKDHQLYLYILIDSDIPKNFSLTITINIYIQKSFRNLQQEYKKEMEINILPLNCTNSNSFGGLFTFVSDQAFKDYLLSEGEKTRIVVTNMIVNKNNNDGKNEYIIKKGVNSDYLDTAKMEEMIMNNQIADLSLTKNINIYHLESVSQGCSFKITTKEILNISDRKLNLDFQDIKTNNKIITECSLYKNNNIMNCNMNEFSNSNYILNDYIIYDNNELVSIISDNQNGFPMSCKMRYNYSKKSNGLSKEAIVGIIIAIIIIISISVGLAYLVFKKYKQNKTVSLENITNYPSSVHLNDNKTYSI